MSHPGDYTLVRLSSDTSVYRSKLYRLYRGARIPKGYELVIELNNRPVYSVDGRLLDKYWTYPRIGLEKENDKCE